MKIRTRNSNFSRFSDALWLVAEYENTRIDFDIHQDELLEMASMFADLAYLCLNKLKRNTDHIEESINGAIEDICIMEQEPAP